MSEAAAPSSLQKQQLRLEALGRRDAMPADARAAASAAIAERARPLLAGLAARHGGKALLAGYWPIRSECDPRPSLRLAHEAGLQLALPDVTAGHIRFRAWALADPLVPAGFGTLGPLLEAPVVHPDALLVPLAAFDRAGHRIGYGKGHYDRAINELSAAGPRPLLIGLAFGVQEVVRVPAEAHDVRLDFIVTEKEYLAFGGG